MERLDPPALLAVLNSTKRGASLYSADEILDEINQKYTYDYPREYNGMDKSKLSKLKSRKIAWDPLQYGPELLKRLFKALPNGKKSSALPNGNAYKQYLVDYIKSKGWLTADLETASQKSYDKFIDKLVNAAFKPVLTSKPMIGASCTFQEAFPPTPKSEICLHDQDLHPLETFYGRKTLLKAIRDKLLENHVVVLQGIGGIGKTSLANEYAAIYKVQGNYSRTQSISFAENAQEDVFLHTLLKLNIDGESNKKHSESEIEQYRRLSNIVERFDEHTLLIIDNMDRIPDDMDRFDALFQNTHCHFIITTRMSDLRPADQINVDTLSGDEQIELFRENYRLPLDESEIPLLCKLLKLIEGHTLLIELIAKTMHKGCFSFNEMICHMEQTGLYEQTNLPSVENNRHNCNLDQHICTLFNVDKLTDKQRHMLVCLSLLPNDGIPKFTLLRNIMTGWTEDLDQLIDNGWVKESRGFISLHPVIRQAVRKETAPKFENTKDFLLSAIQLADNPPVNSVDCLCGLGETAFNLFFKYDDSPLTQLKLDCMEAFRKFAEKAYRYKSALEITKKALGLCKTENCLDNLQSKVSSLHAETGNLYKRLAKYESAIEQYRAAIKLDLQNGNYYLRLGETWRKASQYDNALKNDKMAIELLKDTPLLQADAKNEIGVVWVNKGDVKRDIDRDYSEAIRCYELSEKYYQEALELREQYGASKKDTAYSYHNIGSVYQKRGECELYLTSGENSNEISGEVSGKAEFEKALSLHLKALKLREAPDSGVSKPDIAASNTWLAKDLIGLRRFDEAKNQLNRALKIRGEIFGEKHPDYLWTLDTLCDWYDAQNLGLDAIRVIEQVLSSRIKILGPDHNYSKQAKKRLLELKKKYPDIP